MVTYLPPGDAVTCKVCGQERRKIRKDGTLATHRQQRGSVYITCRGSGRVPKEGRVDA